MEFNTVDFRQRAQVHIERMEQLQAEERHERREGREVGRLCRSLSTQLHNCNVLQLRRVKKLCDVLIAKHGKAPEAWECQKYALTVLCTATIKNRRYQVEMRACGKACTHLPHGPYVYEYHYDGSLVRQRSLRGKLQDLPQKLRSEFRHVFMEAKISRAAQNIGR